MWVTSVVRVQPKMKGCGPLRAYVVDLEVQYADGQVLAHFVRAGAR